MSETTDPNAAEYPGRPGESKGHRSVAIVRDAWYVLCTGRELKPGKHLRTKLYGEPIVVFRNASGQVGALLDRCPHRNVPLSFGRVRGERLQCGYHGWEFDPDGTCRLVPGLCGIHESPKRNALSFAVTEQDGFVWAWGRAGAEPQGAPYELPVRNQPGYTTVRRVVEVNGSLHAAVENALDVPHTAYLHRGLFRGNGEPNDIRAVVTRTPDSVQAQYLDEPRPSGFVARMLAPSGGVVEHYDRFVLPCVAEVEYRLGTDLHWLVVSICTPVEDFVTRMYAVICFKLRIPGAVVKPLLSPFAMQIFRQDADVLRVQTENIERFDGERYVSTEIDLLGGQIWRLLRMAEQGRDRPESDDFRREVRLRV